MAVRESFVRAFHDARPGVTRAAFARGGSYARLAAAVPADARRVLDLACGDGELLRLLGPRAVGIDVSLGELRAAGGGSAGVVQGRAQALPFADAAFDAVTCHLALMLFDDLEIVAAELARVLAPGGRFCAVVGGGPIAGDDDGVYERWLAATHALRTTRPLGDPRASREPGWRDALRGFIEISFDRFEVELGGARADVFATLAASYDCADLAPAAAHAAFAAATAKLTEPLSLRVVLWLARATRV